MILNFASLSQGRTQLAQFMQCIFIIIVPPGTHDCCGASVASNDVQSVARAFTHAARLEEIGIIISDLNDDAACYITDIR
jgi:hypothetical protein